MNRFGKRRDRIIFTALAWSAALTVFLSLERACEGAPPSSRRNAIKEDPSSVASSTPKRAEFGANRARPRRNVETNDGALPESGAANLAFDDELEEASNWLDPAQVDGLRARVLELARENRKKWPPFAKIQPEGAAKLDIRVVEGSEGKIVLYTDLPSSPGVDQIPDALEAAIPHICKFFHLDESRFENWRVEAFLMRDVDAFVKLGALDGPPRFLYGYSSRDRIFAKDQRIEYYNRFLLLHELVHTIMHETFGDLYPRWYSEGSAEFLALHVWNAKKKEIEIAWNPESEDATPGFGRLRMVQEIVKASEAPTLFEILNFEPRDFVEVKTYAWSWALVSFLHNSPKYRDVAALLPYWSLANDPNKLFADALGDRWSELELDWADFLQRLDYSYDYEASSIDYLDRLGKAPTSEEEAKGIVVDVEPSRGWINTGVRLSSGVEYRLATKGRFQFYLPCVDRTLDFEATGATCQYAFGKPIGRLEAVVVSFDAARSTFAQIYELDDAQGNAGFRFNAFRNESSRGRRTRFGAGQTGFDVESLDGKSAKKRATTSYNALYPWNESIGFERATTTFTPKESGVLFLRINDFTQYLDRNKGVVKVQIKKKTQVVEKKSVKK